MKIFSLAIFAMALATAGCKSTSTQLGAGQVLKPDQVSQAKLQAHVQKLAGDIGERNVFHPKALRQAADYIESVWRAQGYEVVRQQYQVQGEQCVNLEVTRLGAVSPKEIVLFGAHYDTVEGSPGANDNATGVAALLEFSRLMASQKPGRTVRFVAFVNEEPPFFWKPEMGSRVYAKIARQRGDDIRAMVAMDSLGYYSDQPGSQKFPPGLKALYPDRVFPDRGNFLAFIANPESRALLERALKTFRAQSDFPTDYLVGVAQIPGIGFSDHESFWREGYRAIFVTDTATFRDPSYHTAQDTVEKINFKALTRVTEGLFGVIKTLAAEKDLP
jgi:hypothetical protein